MKEISDPFAYRGELSVDGSAYQVSVQFPSDTQLPDMVPHNHARYELHALRSGSAVLEFENRPPVSMQGGECWLIAPHVYHQRRLEPGSPADYFVMFIHCPKGMTLDFQEVCALQCAPELLRLFEALESEFKSRRVGSDDALQSLGSLLLIAILRELTPAPVRSAGPVRVIAQQREDLMDSYFAIHYAQELRAGDLAAKLGITPRQLARIMQQRYGCTFRQHLLQIRLYHARAYLTGTALPACRIAMLCGFASQAAFTTAFQRYEGCSPTQYRKAKGKQA